MSQLDDKPAQTRDIALDTYRYLRGGMVVMIVMLGAAVIGEKLTATCWQTSISAYYFTSAHSIFIAALCAVGAQLIVYRGSTDTEDVLLNLAGILAFVVAMVPTGRPERLCGASGLPAEYKVEQAITNNVWAVIIALVVAQLVSWWQRRRTRTEETRSVLGSLLLWIFWAVVAVGLVGLIFFRDWFNRYAHGVAAVTMFLAIIVTVGLTAFLVNRQDDDLSPHRRRYYLLYQLITWTMLATLVSVVLLHFLVDNWNHAVIVVETALILEFAAYWAIQTVELWRTPNREELIPESERPQLAQRRRTRGPIGLLPEMREVSKYPIEERLMRAM